MQRRPQIAGHHIVERARRPPCVPVFASGYCAASRWATTWRSALAAPSVAPGLVRPNCVNPMLLARHGCPGEVVAHVERHPHLFAQSEREGARHDANNVVRPVVEHDAAAHGGDVRAERSLPELI